MTKSKHTPELWYLEERMPCSIEIIGGNGRAIAGVYANNTRTVGGDSDIEENTANANVLVVAPEMLKALKQALGWLEYDDLPIRPDHVCGPESNCDYACQTYAKLMDEIHEMKALIAKAEGESDE